MSFEPDTTDIVLRQLKEEIAKIREEQFVAILSTNNIGSGSGINAESGIPAPFVGVTSIIPHVIRITKDTGVIDLLNFDGKNLNKDFTLGETITGQMSGATAEVGDIDTLTDTTGVLTLVPGSITGTFNNNENLNGSGAGGNNIADADGSQFTQTGRGHLNAGAGSIIADTENISAPFEIHFIDNAEQDGQTIYLRAQDGQTITLRKPTINDGTTGNLDLDQSFNIIENAIVFLQYQVASNVSETGGWVPQISSVSAGTGTGGEAFQFPILYPKQNLGTQNGVIDLSLNQSDGHYKQITLDGDASLTFSNLPPSINGFKFYVLTIQDGVGGHVYTDLPNSVLFEGSLLGQLQTAPNSQTLWQFSTADGGVNWHASVINPQGSIGQSQTPWLSPIDADNFELFDASQIKFSQAGTGFSFPTDSSIQGISTSGQGLQTNVPLGQTNRWFNEGKLFMQLERDSITSHSLIFFDEGLIDRTAGITFTHQFPIPALSGIRPDGLQLRYATGHGSGQGAFHGFNVGFPVFPQFEIREDVVRSNVNLDLITNDIINIDQAQFDPFGGFVPIVNHGERRITGGNPGIQMNIPLGKSFGIYFEEFTQTTSNLEYSFLTDQLRMENAQFIANTTGLVFVNGGTLADIGTRIILNTGQFTLVPQILELSVSNQTKIEMSNLISGIKMFDDVEMSTFNISDVDVLRFTKPGAVGHDGVIGSGEYGISTDPNVVSGSFNFSVPQDKGYLFQNNLEGIAFLDHTGLQLLANTSQPDPEVVARGFQTIEHTLGDFGISNGEQRLVNTDVLFGTGGKIVNLSDLTAGGLDIDNDLGTVSGGVVEIDWDVSNFHRMIVNGDISVVMNNLPLSGEWQEVTVEFLQDSNGGHTVTFIDMFQNSVVPRISKGTNRYTTVRFYSYNDGSERILAFETVRNPEVPPFYQGIILARMEQDQTSNTLPGNHLEFDFALFFDRIGVSVGVGQQKGIFSGFTKGRTYECVCHFAVENSGGLNPATMGVQWADISGVGLIGTRGTATDVDISDPNLHTATAYFIPNEDTDTLEVRITQNFGNADTVISGAGPTLAMSQVTIKDCGISEAEFNRLTDEIVDEDFPVVPANPPIGFNVNSVLYNGFNQRNPWSNVVGTSTPLNLPIIDGEIIYPFVRPQSDFTYVTVGLPPPTGSPTSIQTNGRFVAGTFGFIKRVRFETSANSLNKAFTVSIIRGDGQKATLFTIGAGINTSVSNSGNTPIDVGQSYAFSFQTTDGLIPSGSVNISSSIEIEWGISP